MPVLTRGECMQVEHEPLEVGERGQGAWIGAEEEKPRAKDHICWLSDINLCIILDCMHHCP